MVQFIRPLCMYCKHLGKGLSCAAFPERIPAPILESKVLHTKPYPGDKGIQFEPAKGQEEEAAEHIALLEESKK